MFICRALGCFISSKNNAFSCFVAEIPAPSTTTQQATMGKNGTIFFHRVVKIKLKITKLLLFTQVNLNKNTSKIQVRVNFVFE